MVVLFFMRENKINHVNLYALESLEKRTITFGTENMSCMVSKICSLIQGRLQTTAAQSKLKTFKCNTCPCRMCKTFTCVLSSTVMLKLVRSDNVKGRVGWL